ncbi:uncharacterized protein LOC124671365 [Lolium rigidum]|uniref:uncharacterized protein LOC124671365 n=1 Tax=Lolium rigidum TaxID=89674 RepID=UPI001F5DE820|nr:uncharacterized protein LOC124671365 [Lolium rigidum]
MQAPCDYQLALADWEGRPAMEPTAWVPGLPLEMTVAAPASNSLVVNGRQQLVEKSSDHEYAVEVFKQAAQSFQDEHDQMKTKIHLFPPSMEDLVDKYAAPNVVAIGPYHHGGTPALQHMESTKHVAAWHFINDSGCSVDEVYGAVCEVADEARSHYDENKVWSFSDDDFKPMMFYDGCFLLQFMLHCVGGVAMDPVLSSAFSSDNINISRDIVLLENQLPWVVVEKLMRFMPSPGLDLVQFTRNAKASLQARQHLEDIPLVWDSSYTPSHLLGLLRYYIVGSTHISDTDESSEPLSEKAKKLSISVSAIELAEIGIEITATKSTAELKEMRIKKASLSGELLLAPLSLDYGNASFLVNMAAFELCTTPDFFEEDEENSTVCSYLCLLGMVTDSEEDVQKLRKKHILQGGAGLNNQDALDLFNRLEKHLRPGVQYLRTILAIENYRANRPIRIMLYRFIYKNFKTIATVVTAIVGFAGFLATLKSLK